MGIRGCPCPAAPRWPAWVAAFLLFRFFDVVKPLGSGGCRSSREAGEWSRTIWAGGLRRDRSWPSWAAADGSDAVARRGVDRRKRAPRRPHDLADRRPGPFLLPGRTEDGLARLLAAATQECPPLALLGMGSNILVADDGFPGYVLRLEGDFLKVTIEGERLAAGGGAALGGVCAAAARAGSRASRRSPGFRPRSAARSASTPEPTAARSSTSSRPSGSSRERASGVRRRRGRLRTDIAGRSSSRRARS